MGTAPGAEDGGRLLGGAFLLPGGGGRGPGFPRGVLFLIGAAPQAPVAFPVVGSAAVGADHHVVPLGKGFPANRAAISRVI